MGLENIVKDYLESPKTTHAILINGKWGSGKTYYWKNIIDLQIVQKTKPPIIINNNDDQTFYRTIYISLYSIRSIDEVSRTLVAQLLGLKIENIFLKKGVEIAEGFLKSLSKLSTTALTASEIIQFQQLKKYVVVFDDIERINSKNLFSEMLGYINILAEHGEAKVVVLTDESKLRYYQDESWITIKEKIVGLELNFSPDLSKFPNDLFERYKKDAVYYEFLLKHKSLIENVFKKSLTDNLRSLFYGLDRFKDILLKITIDSSCSKKTKDLLYSALAICFEIKCGSFGSNKALEIGLIESYNYRHRFQLALTNENEEDKNGKKEIDLEKNFVNKYFNKDCDLIVTNSLFNLLVTGDSSLLSIKEIEDKCEKFIWNDAYEYKILQNLLDYSFVDMDDVGFANAIDLLLASARANKLDLKFYTLITFAINQLIKDNLLEIDKDAFNNEMYDLVSKRNINKQNYLSDSDFGLDESIIDEDKGTSKIKTLIITKQNEYKSQVIKDFITEEFKKIQGGQSLDFFSLKSPLNEDEIVPVLNFINEDVFIGFLQKCSNKFLAEFKNYLSNTKLSESDLSVLSRVYDKLSFSQFDTKITAGALNTWLKKELMKVINSTLSTK